MPGREKTSPDSAGASLLWALKQSPMTPQRRDPHKRGRKVLDLVEAGRPVAEIADQLGVTGQTIYDAPTGSFKAVSAGSHHSCGLRTDGTIACWGENTWGQVDAPAGTFTVIAAGWQHSCGLRTDGTIRCWDSRVPRAVRD